MKVVTDLAGDAIYFSRCPIPFAREGGGVHYKHFGLYVYRRDFLLAYSGLPVGPLERMERLEQLRAIENGHRVRVVETEYESLGVDTPEDLERVSALFEPSLKCTEGNFHGQIYLRHRRRGFIARERHRGGFHRLSAGKPRAARDRCRNSILISTSIRAP